MAEQKRKVTVTYEESRFSEIDAYAKRKDMTIPALIKFALRQYMERFPLRKYGDGGKDAKAVQLHALEGK
jgi:hypothetical protein